MMNYRTLLVLTLLSMPIAAQASGPCRDKQQDILREIGYAEKNHNQKRVEGLNKALNQLRTNCHDGSLRAEHRRKIARQQAEVEERRVDLNQAHSTGDPEKIAKRERKLAAAESSLKTLQARDY